MINIKKILYPTDFSECSKHALKYAISFCKEFKAKLYILHIIDNTYLDPSLYDFLPSEQNLDIDWEGNANKRIDLLIESEIKGNIEIEKLVGIGTPFVEIINTAKEKEVDLIVIATHGRTGLKYALFGSTAEKVVRKSYCPVLSVKHPEHEFVSL